MKRWRFLNSMPGSTMSNDDSNEKKPLNTNVKSRSLDDFLEEAFVNTTIGRQWKYWSIILSCGVAIASDASEILSMSYILSDEAFDTQMLQNIPWRGGLLAASIFLGMFLGGVLIGPICDRFGRRPTLLSGLCINTIAGILSAASPNVYVFSVLRFIAGAGIGATVPPTFTLVSELAPPSRRGVCVTLCASFWMLGSVYAAASALCVFEWWGLSWRVFALACAGSSVVAIGLCYALVPESPRFLACCHPERYGDALEVANFLAAKMDYTDSVLTMEEIVDFFPHRQPATTRLSHPRQEYDNDTASENNRYLSDGTSCGFSIHKTTKDLATSIGKLYGPELRHTTWPLQLVWFSLSFGSYGLLTWINVIFRQVHLQNVYYNALIFAASSLPGVILTAVWMDKLPRGKLLATSITASALSLMAFAACAFLSYTPGIVLSACTFQCFNFAAWNTLDCMTSELFPTTIRSTGVGICSACGKVGAMVAQLINGFLIVRPAELLLVLSLTLLGGAVMPYFLPHRSNMTGLPVHDTLPIGEGEGDDDGSNITPVIPTSSEIDMLTPLKHSQYLDSSSII